MIRRLVLTVLGFFHWLASDEPEVPGFVEPEPEPEDYLEPNPPQDWVDFFKQAAESRSANAPG